MYSLAGQGAVKVAGDVIGVQQATRQIQRTGWACTQDLGSADQHINDRWQCRLLLLEHSKAQVHIFCRAAAHFSSFNSLTNEHVASQA